MITNLSLIQCVVPNDVKSARVVPLFKTVIKQKKISIDSNILTIILKVLEKVVYGQVES